MKSEIYLYSELNQAGIGTRGDYATKVARAADNSAIAGIDRSRCDGAEIADRIGKVYVIEKVEELGAQLNVLRLINCETLDDREVHVSLPRPAQNISADIPEVGSGSARCGRTV